MAAFEDRLSRFFSFQKGGCSLKWVVGTMIRYDASWWELLTLTEKALQLYQRAELF
jgi:hypothetical protein